MSWVHPSARKLRLWLENGGPVDVDAHVANCGRCANRLSDLASPLPEISAALVASLRPPDDLVQRLGQPLPCIASPESGADFDVYLAILPGNLLHQLYHEFGARLLELNVRSFLQARGKVNRGIRDTLKDEPSAFIAYNNGISATASEVTLVPLPEGGTGIAAMRDLQIVNGGQTTASVHRASVTGVDLTAVFVQAKVTVIEPGCGGNRFKRFEHAVG